MPNFSYQLDHLRAALITAQMSVLDENIARWNHLYQRLDSNLRRIEGVSLPLRDQAEFYVEALSSSALISLHKMKSLIS